jgi:hypothetical protein
MYLVRIHYIMPFLFDLLFKVTEVNNNLYYMLQLLTCTIVPLHQIYIIIYCTPTVPRCVIWLTSQGYRRHVLSLCQAHSLPWQRTNCFLACNVRQFVTITYPLLGGAHSSYTVLTLCAKCSGHSSPNSLYNMHHLHDLRGPIMNL